jgi:hypothetical protein
MTPFAKWFGGGPPPVTPGSTTYSSPGSTNFTVPNYNSLTVTVRGAGGGGADREQSDGADGGYSQFSSATPVKANGGGAGQAYGGTGANGGASGPAGTSTTTGGGAAGGVGGNYGSDDTGWSGGNGGYAQKTWTVGDAGAPAPGASIPVVVGAGGGGYHSGSNGSVQAIWS